MITTEQQAEVATTSPAIVKQVLPAVKVGRCFNGAERDRGTIVHLVPPLPVGCNGDWFTKALCGAEPGRRGNGWGKVNKDATCPKCLKRYAAGLNGG